MCLLGTCHDRCSRSSVAEEVGVQSAGRGADQPGPSLDEPGPPSVLEGGEPGARLMDVDVDHVDSAGRAGRDADVGVRLARHHAVDDVEVGAGVLEAVGGQRALAAGDAREDRDAGGSRVSPPRLRDPVRGRCRAGAADSTGLSRLAG